MALPASTTELIESLEQYDDVVSWINDTLDTAHDDDASSTVVDLIKLDHELARLLASLDIAAEDTSSQLERIIDDVSRGIPRLTYDLHFMKDGASTLQASLSGVLQKSKDAIPDTTRSILEILRYLDTVKNRMEASREVLREAESWSTLELEVTFLIGEQNYAKAAERLSEASKSMVVFQNTPEYDPRRALMVSLQNQLEASLSTALVSAITAQDIAACKDYFSIFSTIQRESEFRNYYNASRRSTVVSLWESARLNDCEGLETETAMNIEQAFEDFLPKFYANFLSLLNAERTSVSSIFPDPAVTLSQFISSTLASLHPTFAQRLSSLSSHYSDTSLLHLIAALRATEEFAAGVGKAMEKVKYADMPPTQRPPGATDKPSHARRRSSRMSISLRPGQPRTPLGLSGGTFTSLDITDAMEWDQELFQPFIDFQVDYSSLERRYLEQSLSDIITNDTRDKIQSTDRPRLLKERAVDIFGIAEGSLNRCKSFTHGYGAAGLVSALDSFFRSFFDTWTADIQSEHNSSPSSGQNVASDGDLSDLDYTSQDWADIQLYLHLLASSRAVFERLTAFEAKLRSFLDQITAQFRMARSDPVNFFVAASRGESQLLEQSPLNSTELRSVLGDIDSDPPHTSALSPSPGLRQNPLSSSSAVTSADALLIDARQALFAFAGTCQRSLQQTILSPLRQHLTLYASSSVWNAGADAKPKRANDLYVPTFSLSPTDTVQRVAEGLLNLPRLFEVYVDDDALAFSLQTLPHVGPEMLKFPEQVIEMPSQQGHRRRASLSLSKPAIVDPEVVSSAWLMSLGHTFLDHFVRDVLPSISVVSGSGVAQLASDIEYLSNIVRALNVEHESLEKWKAYMNIDEEEGKKAVGESPDIILQQVAKLRRWSR